MTKHERLLDEAWAKALFVALTRYEAAPLYAATVREHGHDPIREARLASVESIGRAS